MLERKGCFKEMSSASHKALKTAEINGAIRRFHNKLTSYGFHIPEDHFSSFIKNVMKEDLAEKTIWDQYNDRALRFLSESTDISQKAEVVYALTEKSFYKCEVQDRLSNFLRDNENNPQALADAKFVIGATADIMIESGSFFYGERFGNYLNRFLLILSNKNLYRIFSSNAEILARRVKDSVSSYCSDEVDSFIGFVTHNKMGEILVQDGNESFLDVLTTRGRLEVVTTKERANILNRFLKGNKGWTEKIESFLEVFVGEKKPVLSQQRFEQEILLEWAEGEAASSKEKSLTVDELLEQTRKRSPQNRFAFIWGLIKKHNRAETRAIKQKAFGQIESHGSQKLLEAAGIKKEAIERIKRRENPFHPLNTLRIAPTIGYEVEYSLDGESSKLKEDGVIKMLEMLGFNTGGGGDTADEVSPGPFFDPLTANTIFNLQVDSGIINLHHFNAQTCHFNVGIIPVPKLEITQLVRALQASGYSYGPHISERGPDELVIYRKQGSSQTSGDAATHTEVKGFDVIEKVGFNWTMESASFLSWGMSALIRSRGAGYSRNRWDDKLISIWRSYVKTLKKGLDPLLGDEYLETSNRTDKPYLKMDKQLKVIFPNTESIYRDLGKVTSKISRVIKPVRVDGKRYPNISYFVREVTDSHVREVMLIADSIESGVKRDIKKIESMPNGQAKKLAIRNFLEKYKTPLPKNPTAKVLDKMYKKVRSIFD